MEIYINALILALTPQVFFAILGGIIGIVIKSEVDEYGWFYTIFISIGSIIAVTAAAEYMYTAHGVESIFAHMLLGTIMGILGASLLHAFNIFTPKLANTIITKAGDNVISKVDKFTK